MSYKTNWRTPSNIALVKYWGKHPVQIPANTSLSFTLDACHTDTNIQLTEKKSSDPFEVSVNLDGVLRPDFQPKILSLLGRIESEISFAKDYHLTINTSNSFPHSSGIASSASGMAAIALGLLDLKKQIEGDIEDDFFQKASEWARLGSGSACRSLYGGLVSWGEHSSIRGSSDLYGTPFLEDIDPSIKTFKDYVLLVEVGSKSVSSTAGHDLMKNHPFASARFTQANQNIDRLIRILKTGELSDFGQLVESEALSLHAMMMSSIPYYILMKPNTLKIIEAIWRFRDESKLDVYFTLDAGANVHLLFPASIEQKINNFVNQELSGYLNNAQYICDQVGNGPVKLKDV